MAAVSEIEIEPYESLPPLNPKFPQILPIITYSPIGYDEFFNNHMRNNIPCKIQNLGAEWEATKKWIDSAGRINFDYLINKYGNSRVEVMDCRNIISEHQTTSKMECRDFLRVWRDDTDPTKLLYVKQWSLQEEEPLDVFYDVPTIFGSDWLNEYSRDVHREQMKFVFMGPKGAWTSLQSDLYNLFEWSVNITGQRKWFLFPPGEEEKLKVYENVIMRFNPDNYAVGSITFYQLIQEKGEALFIPSGWYHQCEVMEDTLAIHHTWFNGTNIIKVWQALEGIVENVKIETQELKDLKEYPEICQSMVTSLYGMDCQRFEVMLVHIAEKRLAQFEGGSNVTFENYSLGRNHCIYDLKCIQKVMYLMVRHSTYVRKEYPILEKFIAIRGYLKHIFGEIYSI